MFYMKKRMHAWWNIHVNVDVDGFEKYFFARSFFTRFPIGVPGGSAAFLVLLVYWGQCAADDDGMRLCSAPLKRFRLHSAVGGNAINVIVENFPASDQFQRWKKKLEKKAEPKLYATQTWKITSYLM